MFGTLDFIREIGHKIKGGGGVSTQNGGNQNDIMEDARACRAINVQLPKSKPIDIEFSNISYTVMFKKEKKTVLKGVSGKFESGELTAIMGPSGAGKSSLLNILTGFQTTGVSGKISNKECGKNLKNQYKKESCYILQDDQLYAFFTVLEAMNIAADLKIGQNLSSIAKEILINDILNTLGLTHTKNTKCGSLSGGQKKRLSIALELIDNPPVMFLDEPTTGLDSSSTLQCISMLKELARGGRTIVCTVHQPPATVYEMFDHVFIMAEGMCIYQGASSNTVEYLKGYGFECPKYHNPADYILEIANCEYGNFNNHLAKSLPERCWRNNLRCLEGAMVNNHEKKIMKKDSSFAMDQTTKATILIQPPTEISRFWILLHRCLVLYYRDWTVTHLKIALHCGVGIILGLFFETCGYNAARSISNIGHMLVSIVYLSYTSMMPAVLRFPQELLILKKESFNNWYKLRTYYAAVMICSIPSQILFATIYCGCSYFLSSQPAEIWRFGMFLLILCAITLISESIGHIIGTLLNPVNGTFCGAVLVCTLLLFAGFLVLFNHMSTVMYIISYMSIFRYGLEGLVIAVYGFNRDSLFCPKSELYCHLRHPQKILEELHMQDGSYWLNVGILAIILVLLKITAFYTLRMSLRKS